MWSWSACAIAACSGTALALPGLAVVSAREGVLNLRVGDLDTRGMVDLRGVGAFDPLNRYVVMLDGPLTPERRGELLVVGVRPLGYLPTNAMLADLSLATPASLSKIPWITFVGVYESSWKLDPALRAPREGRAWQTAWRQNAERDGLLALRATLFANADSQAVLARLSALGAVVGSARPIGESWAVQFTLPADRVLALSEDPDVQFVEELEEWTPRSNTLTRAVVQSGMAGVTPLYDHGLTGAGQIMGIIDGWVAKTHCAFVDLVNPIGPTHRKILAYNATNGYDFHGTHVAGVAVGDAGDTSDTRGVAYGAKVVFNTWPQNNEQSVFDFFTLHASQGAFVHNNSWGDESTIQYTGAVRAVDDFHYQNEDHLLVYSVSNGSVIRVPENAKNCLAVSASRNPPDLDLFCVGGAGPTLDGRRKPEVTAPGCQTNSPEGNGGCATLSRSGTSFAAPAAAGLALLMRQYFTEGFYPTGSAEASDALVPSGALLRACLVNSAADLALVDGYPSNLEGFGRVVGDSVLYFPGDLRRLIVRDVRNTAPGALSTGGMVSFAFRLDASNQPFRATLAFTDAPANVAATFTPINNLDLVLTSPSGATYRGNVFAGGVSIPGGTSDAINSVEQVMLPTGEAGVWTLRVDAQAVNVGTQGYALAVTGGVHENLCAADLDDGSGTGMPDGGVTLDDLLYFLGLFESGDAGADLDDGTGTNAPDGGVTIDDLVYFIVRFELGC